MPAPSPVAASAPVAPRWARCSSAVTAWRTSPWLRRPCRSATRAMPQASCSKAGSYRGAPGCVGRRPGDAGCLAVVTGSSVVGHAEWLAAARDDAGPAAALIGYIACTGHLRTCHRRPPADDAGPAPTAPGRRPPMLATTSWSWAAASSASTVGLAHGRHAGMTVAVVDPEPGPGASWVAAGMLAPVTEVHHGEERCWPSPWPSARRWPAFAAELEPRRCGRPIGYRTCGTLVVAADEGDRAWARRALRASSARSASTSQWLTGRQRPGARAQRRPRGARAPAGPRATTRSTTACSSARCSRRPTGAGVVRAPRARPPPSKCRPGRSSGVRLAGATRSRPGAWCWPPGAGRGRSTACPPAWSPPVRPVKGQILRLCR